MQILTEPYKTILKGIYLNSILKLENTIQNLSQNLNVTEDYIIEKYNYLTKINLVSKVNDELTLLNAGRSKICVVLTGGVFDIIHPGHIFTLSSAKNLGDVLIVVVARDKTVLKNKNRNPMNNEIQRLELVRSIKFVDTAILGSDNDIYETVLKVRPDIIALGYDQKHNKLDLEEKMKARGLSIKIVRLCTEMPSIKSSNIIRNNKDLLDSL